MKSILFLDEVGAKPQSWQILFGACPNSILEQVRLRKISFLIWTLDGERLWCLIMLIVAFGIVWSYDRGSKGVKIFDWALKIMVGIVVVSFFGVVLKLSATGEANWGEIASGFIPNLTLSYRNLLKFTYPLLEQTGEFRSFWETRIVSMQQGCNDLCRSHRCWHKHDAFLCHMYYYVGNGVANMRARKV